MLLSPHDGIQVTAQHGQFGEGVFRDSAACDVAALNRIAHISGDSRIHDSECLFFPSLKKTSGESAGLPTALVMRKPVLPGTG